MPITDPWGHNKTQSPKEADDLSLLVTTMICDRVEKAPLIRIGSTPLTYFFLMNAQQKV